MLSESLQIVIVSTNGTKILKKRVTILYSWGISDSVGAVN
jgi:hypothetical protein